MRKICFTTFFLAALTCFSQNVFVEDKGSTWLEMYPTCMIETRDHNIGIGGNNYYIMNQSVNSGGAFAAKITPNGDTLWARSFFWLNGGGDYNIVTNILATNDSGLIVLGCQGEGSWSSLSDLYAIRFDKNGNPLWSTTFNNGHWNYQNNYPIGLVGGINNQFYICQTYYNADTIYFDIIKFSYSGNILWSVTKRYFTFGPARNFHFTEYTGNSFLLNGEINDSLFIIKMDLVGNIQWGKKYYWPGLYDCFLDVMPNGNILVTGNYSTSQNWGSNILIFDSLGGLSSGLQIDSASTYGQCVNIDTSITFSGSMRFGQGFEPFLIKLDRQLNILSQAKHYPDYKLKLMKQLSPNEYLSIGTGNYTQHYDTSFALIRFDNLFDYGCLSSYDSISVNQIILNPDTISFASDTTFNYVQFFGYPVYYFPIDIRNIVCNPTNINVAEEFNSSFYPNPFFSTTTLRISPLIQTTNFQLRIYNTLGILMHEEMIYHLSTTISRSGMAGGIYFYSLLSDGKRVSGGKLIIDP